MYDLKAIVYMSTFGMVIFGVVIGCVLGLLGIWIKDFGETGWKLFLTDVVITAAAILIAVITTNFWK